MIRLLALLTAQAPCFGWIVHSDSYNGDDLMAYEMTIPFMGIPSSTWRTCPFFCKRGSCSGVLGWRQAHEHFAPGPTWPPCRGSEQSSCVLHCRGLLLSAAPSRAQHDRPRTTIPLSSSSFPAPVNLQVSFVYSERKEEMWRVRGRTGCAQPKVLAFFFVHVCGWGERERVRKTWAYRIAIFTLCVLSVLCLVDGLHIPIVTSLRRLSTVGCGGMGERIV